MSDTLRPVDREPTVFQWSLALGPDPADLPDGEISGTDVDDWTAALTVLVASGWTAERVRDDEIGSPLPADALFDGPAGEPRGIVRACSPTREVTILFWPHDPSALTFDFDLRELREARHWSILTSLVQTLSAAVRRDVVLLHEGSTHVFARFSAVSRSWSLALD